MKTPGPAALVLLASLTFAFGQSESRPEPPAPAEAPAPASRPESPPVLVATNRLQRIFGPTAVVDGILPEVKRRGGVLSRSDLDAPVIPGREFRNLSINPRTGQPEGVIFLAIRF